MKKIFPILIIIIFTSLAACTGTPVVEIIISTETPVPSETADLPTRPVAETPEPTFTPEPPTPQGLAASYGWLELVVPEGLATGITGIEIPRADGPDLPAWGQTPGHQEISLAGYKLVGKFHEPKIYIYRAQEYAELYTGAFESIRRLNNLHGAPFPPGDGDLLPQVPFFLAAQIFASNIQMVSFQNGWGVRFLTEYAQYAAPVNNHELIYHFQGLTEDGSFYVIAILPITAPLLAETSDPQAAIPVGGVAYPGVNDPNPDWNGYYANVTALLNATAPEDFSPALDQLDALIQSLLIGP